MSNKTYSTEATYAVTVGELIEKLNQLDPSIHVLVKGYEGGLDDVGRNTPVQQYNRDTNTDAWYYGKHDISEDGKFDCIVL
jgi:hypothetical protein